MNHTSMNQAPIRVLVADDHAMVRQGIRAFLETQADMQVVGEAADGEAALRECVRNRPDVLLLDVLMPGGGAAAAERIHDDCPDTRIVVVTSSEDEAHMLPLLRAGALSYVLKDLGPDALADVVRKAATGEAVLHPRVVAKLSASVRRATPVPADALSTREREVLALIAQGMTNSDIAQRLQIGEKTVKTHVSNILAKLKCTDRTQAAVHAWREGLVR
jgi:NarL family two-component system response regulator LiaR